MRIIGREQEQRLLEEYLQSKTPEFVAVYGRRRVGKTFLVNEFFREDYAFSATGLMQAGKADQLKNFHTSLKRYGSKAEKPPKDWFDAFDALIGLLERKGGRTNAGRNVIFLDELPWFDTRKSGFVSALEHFWNGWAASRPEILLIVCGSATSWMMNKLIKSRGGLHNRVTRRIRLLPFTLAETEGYLTHKDIWWGRRETAEAYMIFGGVPYYLSQLQRGMSLAQNVDNLCFGKDAFMQGEFFTLFASLFDDYEAHVKVLEVLGRRSHGMLREEILDATGIKSGGTATKILEELEQCGFISTYADFSGKAGRQLYHLTDFFTAFYFAHMKGSRRTTRGYWSKSIGQGSYNNWIGHSFERLCLVSEDKILVKLGVSGIITAPYAWKTGRTEQGSNRVGAQSRGAQVDLLIDRNDGVINLCECKFSNDVFLIDKATSENLRNKVATFRRETKTRKACHLTMITTYGVKQNKYSDIVQSQVTLDDLF
jgi:AAA+ ATPase superfamily predicted ATPase